MMSEQQLTGPTTACVESTQAGDTPSHSLLVISPSQSAALPTDIASELSCRQQLEYFCPGERHPISRSVHLSRLSAFYPNCRDCVHRADMALFSAPVKRQINNTERRRQRESGCVVVPPVLRDLLRRFLAVPLPPRRSAARSSSWDTIHAPPHPILSRGSRPHYDATAARWSMSG